MTRTAVSREKIPSEVLAKFERSWGHTGGDNESAILEGDRIVSWHKTRKSAQSSLSKYFATKPVH